MKSIFLLLFFFVPILGFSQAYPDDNSYCQIEPYYDYALCAKGIKNLEGQIILTPRYSEITALPNDMILVTDEDKYGVLNCSFDTIIPLKYKGLQWLAKNAYAAKHDSNYFWIFETNDGTGMMNSSLDVIIPPVYDRLLHGGPSNFDHHNEYTHSYLNMLGDTYFYAYSKLNDAHKGVFNEVGKQIIPSSFSQLSFHLLHNNSSTQKVPFGRYFYVKDDSHHSFYTEDGTCLANEPLSIELDIFGLDSSTIIIKKDSASHSRAICLESGLTIESELSDIYIDGFFVYQLFRDHSFRVYSSDLRHVFSGVAISSGHYRTRFESIYGKNNGYTKIWTKGNKCALLTKNGDVVFPESLRMINVTIGNSTDCLWTISQHQDGQLDTLRTHFPNGEIKEEFAITGIEGRYFFTKRDKHRDVELFDPFLFIQKDEKWGALDRNGDLVVPFKYDRFGIPFYAEFGRGSHTFEKAAGYYVFKNEKMGAVDSLGIELFPCKYDTVIVNFSDGLTLLKKGTNYSLVNRNAKTYFFVDESSMRNSSIDRSPKYLSKCDTLFNVSFDLFKGEHTDKGMVVGLFDRDDEMLYPVGIKKDKLVACLDGKERVCDTTVLKFDEPLLLVGHVLINKKGQVVREITNGIIRKTKKFFIHIEDDFAQVIQFSGEKGLAINNFKSAQVEADYVKIKLKDQTVGAISLDGKRWLYEPKYYDITFTSFPPNHAWVKEDTLITKIEYGKKTIETYVGRWFLVDTSYTKLYDFPFRLPLNLHTEANAVFESGHRLGLIDSSLHVIFPPDYEYIAPIQRTDFVLLRRDSSWQIGHISGAVFEDELNSFTYYPINGNIAVLNCTEKDTLIGMIGYDENIEWLVPFNVIRELSKNESIVNMLGIRNDRYLYKLHLFLPNDTTDYWRTLNNEIILSWFVRGLNWSISNHRGSQYFVPDFEFQNPKRAEPEPQFFEDLTGIRNARFVEDYFELRENLGANRTKNVEPKDFYSGFKFKSHEVLTLFSYDPRYSGSKVEIYHNFIRLDSIEKIELSDILIKNDETSAFLRDFALRAFTTMQLLGDSCPDLEKTEELMWSSFHFTEGGIKVYYDKLKLNYDELRPYLTEKGKRLEPW